MLVHVACRRFLRKSKGVTDSTFNDVSDAVDHLLIVHLRGMLPPMALHESNVFRDRHCYCMHTDAVLKRYLPSLHNLYDFYADAAPSDMSDALASSALMSVGEWLAFVEDMGFIETSQVTHSEANLLLHAATCCYMPLYAACSYMLLYAAATCCCMQLHASGEESTCPIRVSVIGIRQVRSSSTVTCG